jgi:hypothetical protein
MVTACLKALSSDSTGAEKNYKKKQQLGYLTSTRFGKIMNTEIISPIENI